MDLIDKQEVRLLESDADVYPQEWNDDYEKGFVDAIHKVLELPTVDAVPRDYMESEINFYCKEYSQRVETLLKERDAYRARYNEILQKSAERDLLEPMKLELKVPIKRGSWKTTEAAVDSGMTTCSYCHNEFYIDDLMKVGNEDGYCEFCPSCGADMRGDTDGNKVD